MTTKHTPGPWVWAEGTNEISRRWNNFDWKVASVGNHRLGWHENKNCEGREAGANARLIAAAPELLDACRLIVSAFDALKPSNAARNEPLQINAARAAIAKATA